LTYDFLSLPAGALSSGYTRTPVPDGHYVVTATSTDPNQTTSELDTDLNCAPFAGTGTATGTATRDCSTGLVTGTVTSTDIDRPVASGGGAYSGPLDLIGAHSTIGSATATGGSVSIPFTFTPGLTDSSVDFEIESPASGTDFIDVPVTIALTPCRVTSSPPASSGAASDPASSGSASGAASGTASSSSDPASSGAVVVASMSTAAGAQGAATGDLASTGARVGELSLAGLVLIVLGTISLVLARRRQVTGHRALRR
jgi:hypothetical protein